jgi:phage terminase Nu1 subunit (DNA packaging protein)
MISLRGSADAMGSLRLVTPTSIGDQILTKQQLATYLGRSTRWVEIKVSQGMPSLDPTKRFPARRFRLLEVQQWLASGERAVPHDRIGRLEAEVARLAGLVEQLQAKAG